MNYQKQTQDSGYNLHANNCRKRNNTLRERYIILYGSQETNANMQKKLYLFNNCLKMIYYYYYIFFIGKLSVFMKPINTYFIGVRKLIQVKCAQIVFLCAVFNNGLSSHTIKSDSVYTCQEVFLPGLTESKLSYVTTLGNFLLKYKTLSQNFIIIIIIIHFQENRLWDQNFAVFCSLESLFSFKQTLQTISLYISETCRLQKPSDS